MASILLVDDDVDAAANAADFLTYENHTIEIAHSGTQGWDKASFNHYDVLILDWDLPGLNGITLLKRYRSAGGKAPVIMLTGRSTLSDKEHGLDSGADDYLTKPFELEELSARVRALLRRVESQKPVHVPLGQGNQDVLQKGQLVGTALAARYEFMAVLGEGGNGIVFKVHHPMMDKLMAIKMLNAAGLKEESLERFKREARAISKLEHSNIAAIHDFGITENEQLYMVMDFIEGMSLDELITQEGALLVSFAIDLMIQLSDAMSHAHAMKVLHRDIKPANVMLRCFTDRQPIPKILDFGLAKMLDPEEKESTKITQFGQTFGSPPYMSPEQIECAHVDERADIYSMGCMFYEMLTGVPPHLGDTAAKLMVKHLTEPVTPLRKLRPELNLPENLELVVMKMLNKTPDKRYQSMSALKTDLEEIRTTLG